MRTMSVWAKALIAGVMVAFCLVGKAQQKEVHGAADSAQGNVDSAEIASANSADSQAVPAEEASKAKAQREVTQEISLAPAAGVSGVVLDGERAIRDLGTSKPIEGVTVIASVKGKLAPLQAHLPISRATTDKEGRYEITSLTEGPCNVCAYVAWPGLIRILGFAKDVALRRGTITEVNLRPIADGATLIVKASAEWPLFLFLATSPAGEKAYGLVHPEDGRILSLGIDCIALGMFFLKPASGEKPPYGVRLPDFLSKGLGEVSEEQLVNRACKLENVPAGTYYVHVLAMSELEVSGAPGHLIGGAKVTLTAGETSEVTIDLESAAKHPRKPILDIPGDI